VLETTGGCGEDVSAKRLLSQMRGELKKIDRINMINRINSLKAKPA
jgi:hypothetical protein